MYCAGQGNTVFSHFVVQSVGRFYCSDSVCSLWPAPFSYLCVRVRILCVLKIVCSCRIKPDCCLLWSPFLLTPLPVSCPSTTPLQLQWHTLLPAEAKLLLTCKAYLVRCSFVRDLAEAGKSCGFVQSYPLHPLSLFRGLLFRTGVKILISFRDMTLVCIIWLWRSDHRACVPSTHWTKPQLFPASAKSRTTLHLTR